MHQLIVLETLLPKGLTESLFTKALDVTLSHLHATLDGSVHLSFVDNDQSQKINMSNTGNDYPTDVLSFRYPVEKHAKGDAAVEIIICTPIARLQAKQYNVSLAEEVSLLFVHGLLHSLGFDHQNSKEQIAYEQTQNTIMKKLNLTTRDMPWSR